MYLDQDSGIPLGGTSFWVRRLPACCCGERAVRYNDRLEARAPRRRNVVVAQGEVFSGGLITSTFQTLLVLPLTYRMLEREKK